MNSILKMAGLACLAFLACLFSCLLNNSLELKADNAALDNILLAESPTTPGPVIFPHSSHIDRGIGCNICHHGCERIDNDPPKSCRTCHGDHDHLNSAVPDL